MAKRKEGFYWVRYFDPGPWAIAEWSGMAWWCIGDREAATDGDLAEIGPRIEPPTPKRKEPRDG